MQIRLLEIPGLDERDQTECKIRVLSIDGSDLVLGHLEQWRINQKEDFKKIMKVMKLAACHKRVRNEKHVRKTGIKEQGPVYEMRADKGHARLFFFYDDTDDQLIVCTNTYWKGKGAKKAQHHAFEHCSKLRTIYFNNKP